MMNFNKLIRPAVGADLSRLPSSAPGSGVADLSALGGCVRYPDEKVKKHYRPLRSAFATRTR